MSGIRHRGGVKDLKTLSVRDEINKKIEDEDKEKIKKESTRGEKRSWVLVRLVTPCLGA